MIINNKIKSILLDDSLLKIEYRSGENSEIPLESINKVYLKTKKINYKILGLCFILFAYYSAKKTSFYIIPFTFIVISFLIFFNTKFSTRKSYRLCLVSKDKSIYSISIPTEMKDEIKSLVWKIRLMLVKKI